MARFSIHRENQKPRGNGRIWLPRKYTHPIRVRVSSEESQTPQEYQLIPPFKVGHGEGCEVQLPGSFGPDMLFEFESVDNPVKVSTPVGFDDAKDYQIFVDGEPTDSTQMQLHAGSKVKIVDGSNNREVELTVGVPDTWVDKFRSLYVLLVMLAILLFGTAAFFLHWFQSADDRLAITETRIEQTQHELSEQQTSIKQILSNFNARQTELESAVQKIEQIQDTELSSIRREFFDRMNAITAEATENLSTLKAADFQAREELAKQTENSISALKSELSGNMLDSLESFKQAQTELYFMNAQRLEALEIKEDRFKDVLSNSLNSIIFIRSNYTMKLTEQDERKEFNSVGTGFIVSENGLAIAPQHVMRPWRYEEEILTMQAMGLVELQPVSVDYAIWTAQQQVIRENDDGTEFLVQDAFSSQRSERGVYPIYIPNPETATRHVPSAFGIVELHMPLAGSTDVAIFQLMDFSVEFSPLQISMDPASSVEPLDEVLAVGYPLSRLQDGQAIPQAVQGFVRRSSSSILELNSALHPGSSGAPILNADAQVIGMAVATFMSDSYGAAVPAEHLIVALDKAKELIKRLQLDLTAKGCWDGPQTGVIDQTLYEAMTRDECM